MSRNSISVMRTFYMSFVGCTFILLYVCTGVIRGTKPYLLKVVYMCLQQSFKIRNCCIEYWQHILRSYQADLEWKPVCVCLLTRQTKRSGDVCHCYPPLIVQAVQTEIYSPCVKMLSARWGSQVIPAGS